MKRSVKITLGVLSTTVVMVVALKAIGCWLQKEIEDCFKEGSLGDGFDEENDVVPEIVDLRKERK